MSFPEFSLVFTDKFLAMHVTCLYIFQMFIPILAVYDELLPREWDHRTLMEMQREQQLSECPLVY